MLNNDLLHAQGDTVLERVLMAIIDAHDSPGSDSCQRERLDTALSALLGRVSQAEKELGRALNYIASERRRDACDTDMAALRSRCLVHARPVRSVSQLAEAAAREVMGYVSPDEIERTARQLCDLYRARRKAHVTESDPQDDALKAEAVERICAELEECGIPTRLY